mmetsp:Transcript_14541/g.15759  ORF Transcript_14541/g.15759 Transcript_14541/m.15759 type:complete len:225 (+) Transcript_14541:2-676(+)
MTFSSFESNRSVGSWSFPPQLFLLMARSGNQKLLRCVLALLVAFCLHRAFVGSQGGREISSIPRGAAGKLNVDKTQDLRDFLLTGQVPSPSPAPEPVAPKATKAGGSSTSKKTWDVPVLQCDEGCISAIESCLEDGCSVEAMMKLDAAIAKDEKVIKAKLKGKEDAWLSNFLQRSGALRAQLAAMVNRKESEPWMAQLVKAASLAFKTSREGDYPKVGPSSYSS